MRRRSLWRWAVYVVSTTGNSAGLLASIGHLALGAAFHAVGRGAGLGLASWALLAAAHFAGAVAAMLYLWRGGLVWLAVAVGPAIAAAWMLAAAS